jgi:hypothetical protein
MKREHLDAIRDRMASPKLDKRSLRIAEALHTTAASRLMGAALVAREKARQHLQQTGVGACRSFAATR